MYRLPPKYFDPEPTPAPPQKFVAAEPGVIANRVSSELARVRQILLDWENAQKAKEKEKREKLARQQTESQADPSLQNSKAPMPVDETKAANPLLKSTFAGHDNSRPAHYDYADFKVGLKPYDNAGLASKQLQALLYYTARNSSDVFLASDGNYTILNQSGDLFNKPPLYPLHEMRDDLGVNRFIDEVLKRTSAGELHPWPEKVAREMTQYATNEDRKRKSREDEIQRSKTPEYRGPRFDQGMSR